ncbi:MAG TPA: hypothetical protein P5060_01215, partial [Candidatus Absconditabacterales bacterium]|nr:hypothetical protein [Candidatus Absconditabacterales bacterium]
MKKFILFGFILIFSFLGFGVFASITIPLSFENTIQYIQKFFVSSDGGSSGTNYLQVNPNGSGQIYFHSGLDTEYGVNYLGMNSSGKIVKTSLSGNFITGGQVPVNETDDTAMSVINAYSGIWSIGGSGTGAYFPLAGNSASNPIVGDFYMENGNGYYNMSIGTGEIYFSG